MSGTFILEKVQAPNVSDEMIAQAAELFSSAYGVWGPLAEEKMGKFCKPGRHVKMSKDRLREQSLAPGTDSVMVRATVDGKLAGHAFATYWVYEGRKICWVTQLCVGPDFRGKKLATKILLNLRENEHDCGFGILSSHPAAILAALRAFGQGIEKVNLGTMKEHLPAIMQSSPVAYVRTAKPTGSLFGQSGEGGTICCADTEFWVDHAEPMAALEQVKDKGVEWPFGELPEGCEFLAFVKGVEVD